MLSFFDHRVSEPIPFESLEDILEMKPIGGGGTSFYNIFKKLGEFDEGGLLNFSKRKGTHFFSREDWKFFIRNIK